MLYHALARADSEAFRPPTPLFRQPRAAALSPSERLLFVQTNGIGNVLTALPMLRQLRQRRPGIRIDFLAHSELVRSFIAPEQVADDVLVWREQGVPAWRASLRVMRRIARRYDTCLIGWRLNPRNGALLCRVSGARTRIGSTKGRPVRAFTHSMPFHYGVHEVEAHFELARFAYPELETEAPTLRLLDAEREAAAAVRRELGAEGAEVYGMHPGSDRANPQKRWPVEHFAEAARLLASGDGAPGSTGACAERRVWVFLGPDEMELASAFDGFPGVQVVHGHDIRTVCALTAECQAFLNSDSGLGHVAAACGVPTLTLFGPEDPRSCRPYGPHCQLMSPGLDCQPCESREYSKQCPHRDCLASLRPGDVAAEVRRVGLSGPALQP